MTGQVIVFKGKHDDTYYDASTPEKLARACALELKSRHAEGWFYREYEGERVTSPEIQELMDLSEEEVAALPESLRGGVMEKREKEEKARVRRIENKREEDEWFDILEKVIAMPEDEAHTYLVPRNRRGDTMSAAYMLIQVRQDYEYEGYRIEKLR